jgi:hypothetical protein
MLTFEDLASRLAHGQLKNTAAVEDENLGYICPEFIPTILSLANQGLVDLATRFPLFKSQVDLTFSPGRNVYPLKESELVTYLSDTPEEPFQDVRFIRILDLFDETGARHTVNTNGHILTPSFNTLRITTAKQEELGAKIRIRYQQKATELTELGSVDLPPNLETALQLFVASLFISHMGSPEHSAKGDAYYGVYLRHVGEDEAKDLSSTSEVDENSKFHERGFV